MIIYGTRMYGRKNKIRSHGRCDHCRKLGAQSSYDGRKWGHLYFIPLVPAGGKVRVLRECASCRMGSHIPLEKLPGLVEELQKTADRAVVAVGAKEPTMEFNGRPRSIAAVLGSIINDIYCIVGEKELRQLVKNLKAVHADEELLLVEAKTAEITGRHAEAEVKFRELSARSQDPVVIYQTARFFYDRAKTPEAIALAERVETMLVADLDVKQLLIECYDAQKNWGKVAITYENCFLIAPALKEKGAILKAYKKACKKAGREPEAAP